MSWQAERRTAFEHELAAAAEAEAGGDPERAFAHLERAHIIGQRRTLAHVRVHWRMFRFGLRRGDAREVRGQIARMAAALLKTVIWVPIGNTGGANVNPLQPMPVPEDLRRYVD